MRIARSAATRLLSCLGLCVVLATSQGCTEFIARAMHGDGLVVIAERRGEEIRFHLIDGDGEAMITSGFSVRSVRSNGNQGECYWMIDADPNVPWERRGPVTPPIIYGQTFPGMLTRIPAIPLIPGEYVIDGDAIFVNRKENYGFRMGGRFFVLSDGRIELPTE